MNQLTSKTLNKNSISYRISHFSRLHLNRSATFVGSAWIFAGASILFACVLGQLTPALVLLGLGSLSITTFIVQILTHSNCEKHLPDSVYLSKRRKVQHPSLVWILGLYCLTGVSFLYVFVDHHNHFAWLISSVCLMFVGFVGVYIGGSRSAQRCMDNLNVLDDTVVPTELLASKTNEELSSLIGTALNVREIDRADQISKALLERVDQDAQKENSKPTDAVSN